MTIARRLWEHIEQRLADRYDPDADAFIVELRAQATTARTETRAIREERDGPSGNDFLEVPDTGRLRGDGS